MKPRSGPRLNRRLLVNGLLGAAVVVASIGSQPATAATQAAGGVDSFETPAGVGTDGGQVFDRSHSGTGDSMPVGAISQPKSVTLSAPGLAASFDGINHNQQRFGTPNQFSLEPPDQGLCVGANGKGNTDVVEVVNDTFRVYSTAGAPLTPLSSLNSFFVGFDPAIVRTTNPITFGQFVTDPSCLYDASTHRWFVDILTIDTFNHPGPDGLQHFTGVNHLDIAVSQTEDPAAGTWNFFHINVTDDGTTSTNPLDGLNPTPDDGCTTGPIGQPPSGGTHEHACLGDYPHIGSNADSVFLTTNEYSLFGNEFHGALIYAMSKASLEGLAPFNPKRFNTHDMNPTPFALNGFTLWPSVTPTSAGYGAGDTSNGGTEYFLSSNGAAEAHDTGDGSSTFHPSTELLSWAISNTSMLDTDPGAVTLSVNKVDVGLYTLPPSAEQKSGNQPLKTCLNSSSCSQFLEGIKDPFAEKSANLDSNDTRMQQVTWVGGHLWGALDTGLSVTSQKQAGIEWFNVSATGGVGGDSLAGSGYLGIGNDNVTYPAIGITAGGTGVMAFTVVGSDFYPSAGYATIGSGGVGDVHIAAMGQGPDDGFSDYRLFANPPSFTPRPRWGDYGAAVPWGSGVWLASEYIGQSCNFNQFLTPDPVTGAQFRCGNTRTALANWGTRISRVAAP